MYPWEQGLEFDEKKDKSKECAREKYIKINKKKCQGSFLVTERYHSSET